MGESLNLTSFNSKLYVETELAQCHTPTHHDTNCVSRQLGLGRQIKHDSVSTEE